ncbi:MAG TPA: hypothetical protein VI796_05300 [Candidatus Thermoplasmatota archaeon]|nr:hypothetical protein [Candidatus Thermoplasmatota archaeon]
MSFRTLLALLLATAFLLAGCSGDGDSSDDGSDGTGTDDGGNGGSGGDRPVPEQTEFTFGPSLGCEGAAQPGACISFAAGTAAPAVDGHWLALGEAYWDLDFTSTVNSVQGDSDCYFVAADAMTILGDASSGAGPCGGTVPDEAGYLFLYSYVDPSQGMTVTFLLPE